MQHIRVGEFSLPLVPARFVSAVVRTRNGMVRAQPDSGPLHDLNKVLSPDCVVLCPSSESIVVKLPPTPGSGRRHTKRVRITQLPAVGAYCLTVHRLQGM